MSIKRLSNNKFKIIIELGYDVLGNRRRKTETFNGNKSEATKREAELKSKYYHIGQANNISDLTFSEYSQIFLKRYCENVSLTTKYDYEKNLKKIIPLIGNVKLNKITPLMLDKMYQQLKVGKNGKPLGYYSVHNKYKIINTMFNQAIKWELMERNPNLKATKPKKEKTEKHCYNLEQVQKLMSCLENENIKYRTLITLTLDSGLRRSEICGLRWSDIDLNKGSLRVERSLKVVKGVVDETTTKTESSKREIMLSPTTIKLLKEYKEWQDNCIKLKGDKWLNENRVFTSKNGSYINPSTCLRILNKVVAKYDLEKITFHELRHTSASVLIHKGINPKAVSKRLGHSSTSITMEIYSHAFDVTKQESANAFEEVFQSC